MFNLKKSLILISLLLVLALSLSAVSASDISDSSQSIDIDVSDVSIESSDNDINIQSDVQSEEGTFEEVQSLIDSAEDGDVITLENKNYSGNGTPIVIDKTLKIVGSENTVLDALEYSNIFEIIGDDVTLENLILTNGVNLDESGAGAIVWIGNNGTLSNCILRDNIGMRFGSIIASDLTVYNSEFYNNVAGIPVDENEGYDEELNEGGFGGAITTFKSLKCVNCYFNENYAFGFDETGIGGAIFCLGNLSLLNCNFENNYAQMMGGAIFISDYQDEFDKSYPSDLLISNCSFVGNFVEGDDASVGGAIVLSNNGLSSISDSLFEDSQGSAIVSLTPFNCTNCDFINNHGYDGGAISAHIEKGSIIIDGCNFNSNSAENSGGAIYCEGTLVSKSSYYEYNSAGDKNVGGFGGAIYNKGKFTCLNSTFIANYAPVGGAIHNIYYKTKLPSLNSLTSKDLSNITKSSFYNNSAERGGAVSICTFGELTYCIFDGNVAYELGSDFVYSDLVSSDYVYSFSYLFNYDYNYWGWEYNTYHELINSNKLKFIHYIDGLEDYFSGYYCGALCPSIWYNNPNFTSDSKISQFYLKLYNLKETYGEGNCYFALINGNYYEGINENQKILIEVYKSGKLVKSQYCYNSISYLPFNLAVGKYTLKVYYEGKVLTKDYTVTKAKGTLTAKAISAYYRSDKNLAIKLVNYRSKNPVSNQKVAINLYIGSKKYKTFYATTNSKGYAYFNTSKLTLGKYTVYVACSNSNIAATRIKTTINVIKAKTTVSAPKVTNAYKKSAYFKVTLKHASTGKVLSGVVVTIRVYTGKSYKTYTVKTNSKGVAQINTNSLGKGTHKVIISSTNRYYTVSRSGYLIVIK